jgi:amidophosphoribosyltransferase
MARDAGARKVYFCSASPPVIHPNVYGIDMPAVSELIAHGKTVEEVQTLIGADWLVFQDLEDLIASCAEGSLLPMEFECSVFDGKYITQDVTEAYLAKLEARRNDVSKLNKQRESELFGITNGNGSGDEEDGQLSLHSNS